MKFFRFFICILFLLTGSQTLASEDKLREKQRQWFLQAEKALEQGRQQTYLELKNKLTNYPLYPYLEYAEITRRLSRSSPDKVRQFLETREETPLAGRLRSKWLSYLARDKQWSDYLAFYPQENNGERLHCYYLNALLQKGDKQQAFEEIGDFWLHGSSRHKSCDPVFKQWKNAGFQTTEITWQRIALAFEKNQIRLAKYLARPFSGKARDWFDQWRDIRRSPESFDFSSVDESHPYRKAVLSQGIQKLARKDLPHAIKLWENLKLEISFSGQELSRVERSLSYRFLNKTDNETFDYLVFTEPCDHDTKLQEIRIRAALLHDKWSEVLGWLDYLPENHQQKDRWLYWRARSLTELGKQEEANEIFKKLSTKRSYYGFLAADILDTEYSLNHAELDVDMEILEEIGQQAAMLRAHELLQLKRKLDARREWFQATAQMDQEELLAAAKLAHQWNWHDRAILTIAQAKFWDDLEIRFPVKHKKPIFEQSEDLDLDPAWIYAMVRQESVFMHDARSPVGALGLMQLMPNTAKQVARKLKQNNPSKMDLFKPEKNIELGSNYLRLVYDQLNQNPVLAIAAYNAGPHRVKKWLPEENMSADVWIELVPFKETRRYLKSVLAYTVIYGHKLGVDNPRMIERMPQIQPASTPRRIAAAAR